MRGGIRISPHRIFGPSNVGGNPALIQQSDTEQLFQTGEGIADIFSSIYRKMAPMAGRVVKKIANSKLAKEGGKKLLDSAVDVAKNVTVDVLEGNKPIKQSLDDNLNSAKKSIANSIRKANKRSFFDDDDNDKATPKKKYKKAKKPKIKRKNISYNIFQK